MIVTTAAIRATSIPGCSDLYFREFDVVGEAAEVAAADPATAVRSGLAEVLAQVLGVDEVPVDGDFFDDLGANSLLMAHFCARVRKRSDLPSVSIRDVYGHPTIGTLAAAVAGRVASEPAVPDAGGQQVQAAATLRETASGQPAPAAGGRGGFVVCGALQLLVVLGYAYLGVLVGERGYAWVSGETGLLDLYLRSVAFGSLAFSAMCLLPVVAKWVLIGRWKPQELPLWSLSYLRFWIVKSLLHANPMVLFVGNPVYPFYLRALGASIGRGVTILSPSVPVATDLLTIGAGTLIRKDSFFVGYRAHRGRIQVGRVTLGRDVVVGEKTVLDIDTAMGDGAQLGHTSALQSGESVPAGEHWHGSPAQRTSVDYLRVEAAPCGTLRRVVYGLGAVLQTCLVWLPLGVGGLYLAATRLPSLGELLMAPGTWAVAQPRLYVDALVLSAVILFGFVLLGLPVLFTVPRLIALLVKPDRVYPLYGLHYSAHRLVSRMTNLRFFKWLFGDSSYIVHYLRGLGYDLSHVEQTGSNFGTEVGHETPYHVTVGSGTMVADGLSVVNADFSSTSFRVSHTTIGANSFLGNNIAYPSQGRTGDNCLLATKVMIPLDGPVRHDVGLLGSPSFEIPRSVERDTRFDHLRSGQELRRRLAGKNRFNLRSMALFLLIRWIHLYLLTILALVAVDVESPAQYLLVAGLLPLSVAVTAGWYILVERAIGRFRPLQPRLCSIYEPYFWWHERLWKVPDHYLNVFNGTPFKNLVWRLLGVRLGKRVFDDGAYLTERTLTAIGDDSVLNAGSKLHCHSQEDGTFKSDRTSVGARCTLGVGAFIHYGVTIGDGAEIAADSFLMKGEDVPAGARWGGNPATESTGPGDSGTVTDAGRRAALGSPA
jgi:non-ribosomal peptide synthetase-like protein